MDLLAASGWGMMLAGLSILALVAVLLEQRHERRLLVWLEAQSYEQTRAKANVRLLQTRATSLAQEVEDLERRRDELVLAGVAPSIGDRLRAALGGRVAERSPDGIVLVPEF